MLRALLLLLFVFLLAAGGALLVLGLGGDDEPEPPEFGPVTIGPGERDPFRWSADREEEFVARATAGNSHVLYKKSPGGAAATARRVERWRDEIEDVAEEADVDADVLEAMVFLESAGDPDARASDDLEGAVGLTQILAGTATELLGMSVDVKESERLTRRIRRALDPERVRRLEERRRAVDERFDPEKALAGAGRYLSTAEERFGSEELAVVSYHMGIGNLDSVLAAYGEDDVGWAQVYFDATPTEHPRTFRLLSGFGDDSATYLWRVYAAREIMRLYREDRGELARLAGLHGAKASAEEVLHPRARTEVFDDAEELEAAYDAGDLRPFEGIPGMRADRQMGELARRLETDRRLYRGLRPEAYALATYLAATVREVAGPKASLRVTSTVRDLDYQRLLARRNEFATREYSLHTTGFAFDVRRDYASRAQAVAFQYVLDRLESLNAIAWVREPGAIHITVAGNVREGRARGARGR